jgi:hypothetical protein
METKLSELKQVLVDCANDTSVTGTEKRMNQNDRNRFKRTIKTAFMGVLATLFDDVDEVDVFENEKGIALRLDNESIGYITIAIDPMIKDLDYDPAEEATNFVLKQQMNEEKRKASEIAKAKKIEQDAILRAKKDELKRLKAEARAHTSSPHI